MGLFLGSLGSLSVKGSGNKGDIGAYSIGARSGYVGSILGFDVVQGISCGPLLWALTFFKWIGTMGPCLEVEWCFARLIRILNSGPRLGNHRMYST